MTTGREIMTPNVLTARADWSIQTLAELFLSNLISGAPVLDEDEHLVGVVSVTDVLRHTRGNPAGTHERPDTHDFYLHGLENYSREDIRALQLDDDAEMLVRDIMTSVVFDVGPDTRAQDIADTMIKGRIHRVFVTDNKKVVGVISAQDMLKLVRDM